MSDNVPENRISFDLTNSGPGPEGKCVVNFRINGIAKPLFVQALSTDVVTRDATITFLSLKSGDSILLSDNICRSGED